MHSALQSAPFRGRHHVIAFQLSLAVAAAIFAGLVTVTSAQPLAQTGQWSPTNNSINVGEVHMALLPGSSWHSRIVIWGEASITEGAELGWNPGIAGCDAWPYPALAPVPGSSWNPGVLLFCAGHAQLATGPGLLTVGGDEANGSNVWGIPDAFRYVPGSGASPGTLSPRADMEQARFYPTITPLRDGRMVVTGGLRYEQQWYFGGRVDSIPPTGGTGDLLHRFGRGTKSIWDLPVTPVTVNPADPTHRPGPREGHTALRFERSPSNVVLDPYQAFFGGRNGNGTTTDANVYLLRRENGDTLDADYKYVWEQFIPTGGLPPARSDHVAIDVPGFPSRMMIYGGVSQPSGGPALVREDLWKLERDPGSGIWSWSQVSQSGTGPGPRYGHAAAYDAGTRRMYVFGGSSQYGTDPNNQVWVITFDQTFTSGTWAPLTVAGGPPEPRRDHTMVLAGPPGPLSLLVYGGYSGECASSRDLWKLDLSPATPQWSVIATNGPTPGMRANHTAYYDAQAPTGPSLSIFGGEAPSVCDSAVDNRIYSIHLPAPGGSATWVQGPAAPYRLSGHTVVSDLYGTLHARIPEIYNPGTNTWTSHTGSGWFPRADLTPLYPVQFLVPGTSIPGGGGRLLRVGQDPVSRYLDVPVTGLAGSWQTVPNGDNSSLVPDFLPITGVQYLPGRILVLGGGGLQSLQDDRAATFNANAIDTARWAPRGGMVGRTDPNMLMLPNGKVLVVGDGCPQIWDPSSGLWTAYNSCHLAGGVPDGGGYHSTAMLLPDGRVLTGAENHTMRVYCPPYLFDGNNLAPRDTITSAPPSIVYGESFVLGTPSPGQISSVCLIRPAAVTHSFDQNGRYVPLTFTVLPDYSGLEVHAPTSGSAAPPGDYLLFILNATGVPAIARWIHLGNCAQVPCDTDAPPQVTDLYADIVGPNEIWLAWSAPGDDLDPALGTYDLRFSTIPIATETAFAAASPVVPPDYPPPTPGPVGAGQSATKFNLAECTPYHFAIKAKDGFNNWTGRGTLATGTSCGGGGGGFSARRMDEQGEGAAGDTSADTISTASPGHMASAAVAGAVGGTPPPGVLVAETQRASGGGWQITVRLVAEAEGLDPADAKSIVSQVRDKGGAWKTLGRYQPTPGQSPLGLCALRHEGRVAFPAGYALDRVATGLRAGSEDLALNVASHSRLGALDGSFIANGGGVDLALGDACTLTFAPSGDSIPRAASWYLLVRPTESAAPSPTPLRREIVPRIPTRFALYQNQPNPAGTATIIRFDLPVASVVTLEVFDLLGRRVATLDKGERPAGAHTVEWDLRDMGGATVRPGVYIYRMAAGEFRARRKMSVIP